MSDTATETPEAETASTENRVLTKGKLARHLKHERVLPQLDAEIEAKTRLYELCLLFDPSEASRTWDALVDWIGKELVVEKHGQHVLRIDKWADTRKLAYEIKGLKRGTYMVAWLRCEPKSVADIERDLRLDERCIRHLVIAHDFEPPNVGKTAEEFDQKHEEERAGREERRGGGRSDRRY